MTLDTFIKKAMHGNGIECLTGSKEETAKCKD